MRRLRPKKKLCSKFFISLILNMHITFGSEKSVNEWAGHANAHCWVPFDISRAICTWYHEPDVVWENY